MGDAADQSGEAAAVARAFGVLELPATLVVRAVAGVTLQDLEVPVQVTGEMGVDRLVGVLMVALDSAERERRRTNNALASASSAEQDRLLMQEQDREFEEAAAIDAA